MKTSNTGIQFAVWWESEGIDIKPQSHENVEEFAQRITEIAWRNGAYMEAQEHDWMGLSDAEKLAYIRHCSDLGTLNLVESVEKALKERNT